MARITNLATLKTAIADYLARDDLTSFLENFIQNAENKLYRSIHLNNEVTTVSSGISASTGFAGLPTGTKKVKHLYYDGSPVRHLEQVSIDQLYKRYPDRSEDSGYPEVFAFLGGSTPQIALGPQTFSGTVSGRVYVKQDSILDTDPSWYVTNAPDVLLYGSLLEAEPFIQNDARLPVWRSLFDEAVQTLLKEDGDFFESQGMMRQRAE